MPLIPSLDEARLALLNIADMASGLVTPTVRLGVTGLSRAGKTVFITALVHNLVKGGRLPLFEAAASGRISRAYLEPQPDDAVPRFDYEAHVEKLVHDRLWPSSTRRVSELRVTLEFESATFLARTLGRGRLHLDIVDYPGEWLLDLPLLAKDYATWSAETLARARRTAGGALARPWLDRLATIDPNAPEDEGVARELARLFTDYLRAARADEHALSTLPPGRFLMPGDLEGSPALTFAPLDPAGPGLARTGETARSLRAMMERRYEAYKDVVVRPFFRDHFARLDRQIVLVDTLAALNAGRAAVADLETALTEILECFRPGRSSWLASILSRRIDRIVFAATKADHLHRDSHDRLEAILRRLVGRAIERASFAGAEIDVIAMAAVRATREASVSDRGETLPAILGVPLPGESLGGEPFDGESEIAIFPGDLPADPEAVFERLESKFEPLESESELQDAPHSRHAGAESVAGAATLPDPHARAEPGLGLEFVRFRPPRLERTAEGFTLSLPHIRLDRALQFLIGDRLT